MSRRAPYRVGDEVPVLHDCQVADCGSKRHPYCRLSATSKLVVSEQCVVRHKTALRVEGVVELTDGRWRIRSTRCDGSAVLYVVDARGRQDKRDTS